MDEALRNEKPSSLNLGKLRKEKRSYFDGPGTSTNRIAKNLRIKKASSLNPEMLRSEKASSRYL